MAAGGRYFCTAGRGLEPFLARELRARLGATEVDYISGKVFFTTDAEPSELKKIKSGERLFLLIKKHDPLPVSGNKGKILHEIRSLVIEEPKDWLDVIATWKNLRGCEGKKDGVSQENPSPCKRKSEEEMNVLTKRQKTERVREIVSEECQAGAGENGVVPDRKSDEEGQTETKASLEDSSKSSGEKPVENEKHSFSFRVSCRCSGAIAKILTSQIFVHLNDMHSVVGIPLFRLPLANREYIKTAGLRSTIAWAMASLAEISEACYWGTDISDSQLEGADVNIKTAGLMDKIELLKASVKALPLTSESFDAVISDIPFGKKFKITKDVRFLPDILQEMERVLRVGGTIVLLLSQDLHKRMDSITKSSENEPPNAIPDGAGETTAVETSSSDGNSSSVVKGVEEPVLSSRQPCFGSLVPDGVYEVSLGKTVAFIYKYRKISAAGN